MSKAKVELQLEENAKKHVEFIMGALKEYSVTNQGTSLYDYEFDGNNYTVDIEKQINKKTNVVTYSIKNAIKIKNKFFGTNGEIVIKMLGQPNHEEPGYDLSTTKDFLDRGNLMIKAAEALMKGEEKSEELKILKDEFETNIQSKCKLDIPTMRDTEKRDGHFNKKYKEATKIYSNLLLNLSKVVCGKTSKDKIQDALEEIREKEIKILCEQGRPVILKIGRIDENVDNNKILFSMQTPLDDNKKTSGNRTGSDGKLLSNHIREFNGVVKVNDKKDWAKGNDGIEINCMIDGHCSYPTIDVEDDEKRQENARNAVREKLATLVNEYLDTIEVKDGEEIEISLSTMMLLTPIIGEKIDKLLRHSEGEYAQLSESASALDSYDGKELSLKDLGIERSDLENVKVKVDISYMNIPVNSMAFSASKSKQFDVNSKGFEKYCKNVDTYLESLFVNNENVNEGLKNIIREMLFSSSEQIISTSIRDLTHMGFNFDKKLNAEEKKIILLCKRYLDAKQIFNSEDYKHDRNASHVLVTRFLQTNQAIGRSIEAFCKSGEDRTGWVRVRLLADDMFYKKFGKDPDFSVKNQADKYKEICGKAHQLSASHENTAHNSSARGFNVGRIGNKITKKMALLAKKPFKLARKSFKSWESKQLLDNIKSKLNRTTSRVLLMLKKNRSFEEKPVKSPGMKNNSDISDKQDMKTKMVGPVVEMTSPTIQKQTDVQFIGTIENMKKSRNYKAVKILKNGSGGEAKIKTKNGFSFTLKKTDSGISLQSSDNMPENEKQDEFTADISSITQDVLEGKSNEINISSENPKERYALFKEFVDKKIPVNKFGQNDMPKNLSVSQFSNFLELSKKNQDLKGGGDNSRESQGFARTAGKTVS